MVTEDIEMQNEYDFSNGRKNPYSTEMRKDFMISINLRLLTKLEKLSAEKGVSVEKLINRMLDQYVVTLND